MHLLRELVNLDSVTLTNPEARNESIVIDLQAAGLSVCNTKPCIHK